MTTITLTKNQFAQQLEAERKHRIRTAPPEIMTVEEFAIYLGRDVDTVYSKVALGEYPYIKDGRRIFFPLWAVREWMRGMRKGGEIKSGGAK